MKNDQLTNIERDAYVRPEVEVYSIELECAVLTTSEGGHESSDWTEYEL